ncbi:MAG: hypothetical protein ACO3QM_06590 [Candidatus Nanopelagicaceae bacterium]
MKTFKQLREECGCDKKERKSKKKGTVEVMPTVNDGQKGMVTKPTNENYDKGEYDYEGDMAKTQLKGIIRNSQQLHDLLQPADNLPEWVQSKITMATDYIQTATDYMLSVRDR